MRFHTTLFAVLAALVVLAGCKTYSYFNSPNDVLRKRATVYLLNGEQKIGMLSIAFETGHEADKFISLSVGDNDEKITVDSILCYEVGKDFYCPKKVRFDEEGEEKLLFLKRLTKEDARLHLYELFRQKNQTSDGNDLYLYFVSFPGQERLEVWSTSDAHFFPNFDEKVSELLKSCPSLSEKIKQKQKGYFLSRTALFVKKTEVFKRIVSEYNECQ